MSNYEEMISSIINGAGVLAEFCKIQYDAFIRAGFTEDLAIEFTEAIMLQMVFNPPDKAHDNTDLDEE